jgi:predicted porin
MEEEMERNPSLKLGTLALTTVLFLASVGTTSAMPMFSRKYQLECNVCHTVVPRLTETGFQFRAAGYRMPEEIGVAEKEAYNLANYDSVRLQARYDLSKTDNAGVKSTVNKLTFHEITLYPLTGAYLKNYSSLFEISLASGEDPEVENAYVRGNWKLASGHVSVRFGVFHPFEGFGASDRPLAISRPLIQTSAANFNQSTFFTPWGFDEAGLEAGYTWNRTSIRATVFNGLTFSTDENTATPATSLSGSDSKVSGRPDFNSKDYQIFANQILTDNGGGVSLFFYRGILALPVVGDTSVFWKNNYERYAVYASYPIGPALLLGGYQQGKDDTFADATDFGPRSTSRGWFAEGDVIASGRLGGVLRYDDFDPSTKIDNNKTRTYLAALNYSANNGLQAIAEYKHTKAEQIATADRKIDAFQIRFIWIW